MTGYGNSASREAARLRAHARRGVWRRVTAWLGVNPAARRADAQAALWDHGAAGEAATEALLEPLAGLGWHVWHDLRPPGGRRNYDHVLVSPCGTAVVVLDSKRWRRNWPTTLVGGRVHCGLEDRNDKVETAVRHAREVQEYLGLPGVAVWPLLVVHGSPVAGGRLAARVTGWDGPVWVLGPELLVSALAGASQGVRDPGRAAGVAARVDQVLVPYR